VNISNKRKLDHYDKRYPELNAARMTAARRKEIEDKYVAVVDRFTEKGKKKRVRYTWSTASVFKMATDVAMADHYHVIYSQASAMQHGDINGIYAYMAADGNDLEIAPSTRWIRAALFSAHRGLLSVLTAYDKLAAHGFDDELAAARDTFEKIWVKERKEGPPV
jgi:hypothetical protein